MFGIRSLKSGLRAAKPSLSPYFQNIYRIEVKYIFLEIVHQGLSWLKITDIESCWFDIEFILMVCSCRPSCSEIEKVFKFQMIKTKKLSHSI